MSTRLFWRTGQQLICTGQRLSHPLRQTIAMLMYVPHRHGARGWWHCGERPGEGLETTNLCVVSWKGLMILPPVKH